MTAAALDSVLTVVDTDRPDEELSTDELGSRIVGMAGRLAAATCRWLLLVAEFDRREGCARFGIWSTARWLSHHCGIAHRTALEHVRVARALTAFPQLAAEIAAGRLSYSQVRAISRVPRDGEQRLVGDLIQIAQHGSAAQLESMLRGVRTADQVDPDTGQPREYVRTGWTPAQLWSITGRLDPERGAVVGKAPARFPTRRVPRSAVRVPRSARRPRSASRTAPRCPDVSSNGWRAPPACARRCTTVTAPRSTWADPSGHDGLFRWGPRSWRNGG